MAGVARIVDVHEAKTQLSKLLEQVRQGEEIVITKSGRPVARLVAVTGQASLREPGSARGQIKIGGDFDAPLPEDIQSYFE